MQSKWNKFYREKGRFYLLPHPDLFKAIKIFKEENALKIIDIGCGSGRHLIELAENDFLVTGFDYSVVAGHIAEEWLHQKGYAGKIYIGDYEQDLKSLKPGSFDGAVSINSLHYIDSEKKLDHILKQINRILKNNAGFFLVLPSQMTLIFQPNVTQLFLEKEQLEVIIKKYFKVHEFYQDQEKAWVIFASNIKNQNS